jgi:hypothetical protein
LHPLCWAMLMKWSKSPGSGYSVELQIGKSSGVKCKWQYKEQVVPYPYLDRQEVSLPQLDNTGIL